MTCSASILVDTQVSENIELIETIHPGSLEWFRLHAPLPLLMQVFLEIQVIV